MMMMMLPAQETARREGTWAHDTITRRILKEISPRIQKDNDEFLKQHPESQKLFDELLSSLTSGELGILTDIESDAPDSGEWNSILQTIPPEQRNWLDSPWIIAEFYFYRQLIQIFPYFTTSYDLFRQQKVNGLLSSLNHFEDIAQAWLHGFSHSSVDTCLQFGILTSLWGNKKDLSIWPAQLSHQQQPHNDRHQENDEQSSPLLLAVVENILNTTGAQILDNHLDQIVEHLKLQSQSRTVGIILDNAGYELLSDIFLGYTLISLQIADKIVFYTKGHPTFVSDATTQDCLDTIRTLAQLPPSSSSSSSNNCNNIVSYPYCQKLGASWQDLVDRDIFIFSEDNFWCQPTGFHNLPSRIQDETKNHQVVFVKGDANYRRILDDRLWPTSTPVEQVFHYWQSPVCALRALKSEVGCGITEEKKTFAMSRDNNWMVSGEWALIQFYKPSISSSSSSSSIL